MKGFKFSKTSHEKDLGLTFSKYLKPTKYYLDIVQKLKKIVGFIEKTFEYKSEKIISTLFSALVRLI